MLKVSRVSLLYISYLPKVSDNELYHLLSHWCKLSKNSLSWSWLPLLGTEINFWQWQCPSDRILNTSFHHSFSPFFISVIIVCKTGFQHYLPCKKPLYRDLPCWLWAWPYNLIYQWTENAMQAETSKMLTYWGLIYLYLKLYLLCEQACSSLLSDGRYMAVSPLMPQLMSFPLPGVWVKSQSAHSVTSYSARWQQIHKQAQQR